MKKLYRFRPLALVISLILLLTSTVQTTFGYIVTQTPPLFNTFAPPESPVRDLIIRKRVEHPLGDGYVIPDGIAFDFRIDLGPGYAGSIITTTAGDRTADENGIILLSLRPDEEIGIEGIAEGTNVIVTELQKDNAGFHAKDGLSTQETTITAENGATLEFVNVYSPAPVIPNQVSVTGTKVLEGRDWQAGDSFTFLLEQELGGHWEQIGTQTVTYHPENDDYDRFSLTELLQGLTFDRVGTYAFRVSEAAGKLEDISYDETLNYFYIQVTDRDMDGSLEISAVTAAQNATVCETDAGFAVDVTFNNTFVPPAPVPGDIEVTVTVNKTVTNTGNLTIGPEDFEIILENIDTSEKLALRTDADGNVVFHLPFTAADAGKTYHYTLSEVNEGKQDIRYDSHEYSIEITILLSSSQTLEAVTRLDGIEADTLIAQFHNIYHATTPVTPPPTGDQYNLQFWIMMMIASGTAFVALLISGRKRGSYEE